jgi:crotonobetainyl-CoA:carnitine CoA-transferase CaiB-like acyl-CoA transferase
MAGPAAGGVLADWGAEVIKIEPLGGDPMRGLFGTLGLNPDAPNGAFLAANRGKRSIEIEVKTQAGREVLDRLLEGADVLLTNLRSSALERLALTPAEVKARYPRLIYCSVTAYGWGGPDQERAGYDLAAFFGRAGISHQVTTQGTAPAPLTQGLGDTFTAMAAVAGILAALVERQSTGAGRFVEASLLRTGMWALSGELGVQAMVVGSSLWGSRRRGTSRRSCGPSGVLTFSQMSGFEAVAASRRTGASSSRCSMRPLHRNHWGSGSKHSTSTTCGGRRFSRLRMSLLTRRRGPSVGGSR